MSVITRKLRDLFLKSEASYFCNSLDAKCCENSPGDLLRSKTFPKFTLYTYVG